MTFSVLSKHCSRTGGARGSRMVAFVSPLVDVDACLFFGHFSKWFGCSASSSASVEGVFECFEGQLDCDESDGK